MTSFGPSGRLLAVTSEQLTTIVGFGPPVDHNTAQELNDSVCYAGVVTHLELAHYIAQCAYECAYFRKYDETVVPGQYEGRIDLGNTQPGDGFKFHGRGAIQLTGRANYAAFGAWLQQLGAAALGHEPVNVLVTPEVLAQPPYRWLAAAFFWSTHPGLRRAADDDDVAMATRIITGAAVPGEKQGLRSREALTNRAIEVLG